MQLDTFFLVSQKTMGAVSVAPKALTTSGSSTGLASRRAAMTMMSAAAPTKFVKSGEGAARRST